MDVRMSAGEGIATVLADAAREGLAARTHLSLPQPECQALLADARRPVKKERTRQRVATNGLVETLAKHFVAVNGEQGHPVKLRGSTRATNPECGMNPDANRLTAWTMRARWKID